MGHRLSKSVSSVVSHHQHQQQQQKSKNQNFEKGSTSSLTSTSSNCLNHHHNHCQNLNHIQTSHHCDCCLSSSINQIKNLEASAIEINAATASIATTSAATSSLENSNLTLTVPAQVAATIAAPRRFIIKIQLTKMEPGNNCDNGDSNSITINNNDGKFLNGCDNNMVMETTSTATASLSVENENDCPSNNTTAIATAVLDNFDNNLNITKPIINIKFTKNIMCDESSINEEQQSKMQIQMQQQQQEEGQQHHQIIIESDNETTIHQLNNLNATTIAATINNSNFVNNFTVPSMSTSSSSSQQLHQKQQSQLNNEDENNVIEHLSNLNLVPSSANGFILSNNDNNNNNNNNNVSNCNNNFIVTANLNCLNNNSSNSNNINGNKSSGCHQIDTANSICNNQRISSASPSTSSNNQQNTFGSTMCAANSAEDDKSHCCRRKKSSAYPSKWRCCKCSCRTNDASNTTGSSSNCKETSTAAATNSNSKSSSSNKSSWTSKFNCTKKDTSQSNDEITKQQNIVASSSSVSSSSPMSPTVLNSFGSSSSSISGLSSVAEPSSQVWSPQSNILSPQSQPQMTPTLMPTLQSAASNPMNASQMNGSCPRPDHLSMWEPIPLPLTPFISDHHHLHHHHHHHHHIQTTIARCPNGAHHNLFVFSVNRPSQQQLQPQPQLQPSQIVFGQIDDLDLDERARRLRAIEIETGLDPNAIIPTELESALANVLSPQNSSWHHIMCTPSSNFGTVVHSQVDYIHCLVPDLEKITSSSFYWGKMDRYEAERLLEGKPEGTFLLRDSAQEEYLFSVTFRKYGRSLHARIEQFNHKFSFDGHDPGVFTASTVTGLLEHYKDPSCVMFFEPMLTIPLHRNFTFSLQQLCRATIVSHITYDGINELHLPNSLKSYLKEYHYKLRVRVKPFDEPFYTCS